MVAVDFQDLLGGGGLIIGLVRVSATRFKSLLGERSIVGNILVVSVAVDL